MYGKSPFKAAQSIDWSARRSCMLNSLRGMTFNPDGSASSGDWSRLFLLDALPTLERLYLQAYR